MQAPSTSLTTPADYGHCCVACCVAFVCCASCRVRAEAQLSAPAKKLSMRKSQRKKLEAAAAAAAAGADGAADATPASAADQQQQEEAAAAPAGPKFLSLGLSPFYQMNNSLFKHCKMTHLLLLLCYEDGAGFYPFKTLAAAKAKYGAGLHNFKYEDPNVEYRNAFLCHNRKGLNASCELLTEGHSCDHSAVVCCAMLCC